MRSVCAQNRTPEVKILVKLLLFSTNNWKFVTIRIQYANLLEKNVCVLEAWNKWIAAHSGYKYVIYSDAETHVQYFHLYLKLTANAETCLLFEFDTERLLRGRRILVIK